MSSHMWDYIYNITAIKIEAVYSIYVPVSNKQLLLPTHPSKNLLFLHNPYY